MRSKRTQLCRESRRQYNADPSRASEFSRRTTVVQKARGRPLVVYDHNSGPHDLRHKNDSEVKQICM